MKKIVTHSGAFHADDVFAMAALQLYLGDENLEVTRTRDEKLIKEADWVFDVGAIYDPQKQRFDHHQPGAPIRDNGIPYAAFGLVWQQVGEEVAGSKEIAEAIDESLGMPIDANDNGTSLYELNDFQVAPLEIQNFIAKLNPVWGTDEDYDNNFMRAVEIAREVLERFITHEQARAEMDKLVREVYEAAQDKTILVFDQPVSTKLCVKYPDVRAAVTPDDPRVSYNWAAVAIRKNENSFETRFSFPPEWGGLRNEELAQVSGVEDAVFCHRSGFLFITKSKDSAVALAKKFAK